MTDDFFDRLDLSAIPNAGDKLMECEFFLQLASLESSRDNFRWLITAYLNAVYSFFEINALYANVSFTNPETGDSIADDDALMKIGVYVTVLANAKNPYFVKTQGLHPVIQKLYKIRAGATHHFPLSIMAIGENLPEDFQFGSVSGEGEPILSLCREALAVVKSAAFDLSR